MNIKLSITLIFCLETLNFICLAQAPDTSWIRFYGGNFDEVGNQIIQTSDEGYIVCGKTYSFGAGNSDAYLVRLNNNGDTIWTRTFGDIGYDEANSIQQLDDQGFIFTGETESIGGGDLWLMKLDANGNKIWSKTFGGNGYEVGNSLQITADGNYIICGTTTSFGNGDGDIWLLKTNSFGDTLWTKTIIGQNSLERVYKVIETSDLGYVITGTSVGVGSWWAYLMIIKTDSMGNTDWMNSFSYNSRNTGYDIKQTGDGFIVVGTTSENPIYEGDVYLIKTDTNGDSLWTKVFITEELESARSLDITFDGCYILAGSRNYWNGFLLKTDYSGNLIWEKTFEDFGNGKFNSVIHTSDGGYVVTGWAESLGSVYNNIWVVKTLPDTSSTFTENINVYKFRFLLENNFPNPFNPTTAIRYEISDRSFVTIKVYDILGNEIAILVNEEKLAGSYEIEFDGSNLSSGIYFYQLKTENYFETRKMMLMK